MRVSRSLRFGLPGRIFLAWLKMPTIKPLLPPDAAIADNDPNSLPLTSTFVQESILQTTWDNAPPLYGIKRQGPGDGAFCVRWRRRWPLSPASPRLIPPSLLNVPRTDFSTCTHPCCPSIATQRPLLAVSPANSAPGSPSIDGCGVRHRRNCRPAHRAAAGRYPGVRRDAGHGAQAVASSSTSCTILPTASCPIASSPRAAAISPGRMPTTLRFRRNGQRAIFNFMRAAMVWGYPFVLDIEGRRWLLSDAGPGQTTPPSSSHARLTGTSSPSAVRPAWCRPASHPTTADIATAAAA